MRRQANGTTERERKADEVTGVGQNINEASESKYISEGTRKRKGREGVSAMGNHQTNKT